MASTSSSSSSTSASVSSKTTTSAAPSTPAAPASSHFTPRSKHSEHGFVGIAMPASLSDPHAPVQPSQLPYPFSPQQQAIHQDQINPYYAPNVNFIAPPTHFQTAAAATPQTILATASPSLSMQSASMPSAHRSQRTGSISKSATHLAQSPHNISTSYSAISPSDSSSMMDVQSMTSTLYESSSYPSAVTMPSNNVASHAHSASFGGFTQIPPSPDATGSHAMRRYGSHQSGDINPNSSQANLAYPFLPNNHMNPNNNTNHHHGHQNAHSIPSSPVTRASTSYAQHRYSPHTQPLHPPPPPPSSKRHSISSGSNNPHPTTHRLNAFDMTRQSSATNASNPRLPSPNSNAYHMPPPPSPSQRKAQSKTNASFALRFRRVHDAQDIRPFIRDPSAGRSVESNPLKLMTTHLLQTYARVNPAFRYEPSHNPRRVLTKPSTKAGNDGYDNEDSDYILYVNDYLGSDDANKYVILDVLGQGTFGQVVKCQNVKTQEIVAVKVIKNKPAYYNQSMMEVTILELLNHTWDPNDEHHILRLKDQFIHHRHLCLVFELMSSNLYELIKQNSFRGLSTSLVRVFTQQLLDALIILHEARLIHCDLKPENILLKTLQSPTIKVIDFGSACHERQTVYTYIQSRFYRSPEVLLGLPYNAGIDMWSLGCICVELFLGLPLFPGTSEYNQLCRIVEMLGTPPTFMLEMGKQASNFFEVALDNCGSKMYRLKSLDQYSKEHNTNEQPSKRYFSATNLDDIIATYPLARKDSKQVEIEREMHNRRSFIDFVKGLLNLDPHERWTPQQAKLHPFVSGEPFTGPFVPPPVARSPLHTTRHSISQHPTQSTPQGSPQTPVSVDVKRPYGGLIAHAQPPSTKTFPDAAAYNRHLAQQQSYNLMQAQQAYRQSQVPTNPYVDPTSPSSASVPITSQTQTQGSYGYVAAPPSAHSAQHHVPKRTRGGASAATDSVPVQLQRLAMDIAANSGKSMTPVLKRDDQHRAWERRQGGTGTNDLSRKVSMRHHPALDLLTQQAELGYRVGGNTARSNQPILGYGGFPHGATAGAQAPPLQMMLDGQGRSLLSQDGQPQPPQLAHTVGNSSYGVPMVTANATLYDSALDARDPMSIYTPLQVNPSMSPQQNAQGAFARGQVPANMVNQSQYASPPQASTSFWQRATQPQNSPLWP